MTRASAVRLERIDKRFGVVHANRRVDLSVAAGSVHGIVGENGAGKSTLVSILYGLYPADAGRIFIDGREVHLHSPRDAIAAGIGMVHQHFRLVETLSALDNIMLGAEPHWRLRRARTRVRQQLAELMAQTGLLVRLERRVEELPIGERQRVEILKALVRGVRILILDEPTAVLTPRETQSLFAMLRTLKARGTTILLISHKLREIVALCDAVTVMREGAVALDCPVAETSVAELAQAMVGRRVDLGRGPRAGVRGECLLRVDRLRWRDAQGVHRLDDVALHVHAGEIVGIAGVAGNGQSELLDALSGLLTPRSGVLELAGERFAPPRWLSPRRARELRLAHVPQDRHRRGLVLAFPAWESALLGYQWLRRYRQLVWLARDAARADAARMMDRFDVRPRDVQLRTSAFSGGNQQKLVLARESFHEPRVLLVGEPTRGVDIGAIELIHDRLRALRDAGGAVLLVSSDLDEVLALADRVLVMSDGRITGELPAEACTEAELARLMGGLGNPDGPPAAPAQGPDAAAGGRSLRRGLA